MAFLHGQPFEFAKIALYTPSQHYEMKGDGDASRANCVFSAVRFSTQKEFSFMR
jgi:hypothetical protein